MTKRSRSIEGERAAMSRTRTIAHKRQVHHKASSGGAELNQVVAVLELSTVLYIAGDFVMSRFASPFGHNFLTNKINPVTT